jgi:uncharacterized repeat protein (TIGR01451 family)
MNRGARLFGYLLILAALAALCIAIPSAWATPEQSSSEQMTVPTRTPKPPSPAPSQPTERPASTRQATAVPTTAAATAAPVPSATRLPTAAASAALALRKEVAPAYAWPGATLHYTLTLSNEGSASAQQIVLLDTLPASLAPGTISGSADARWDGQVLRVQAGLLPPASRLIVSYTAHVRADAPPGGVISNRATATAKGDLSVAAGASVALPPAELPPTGFSPNGILIVRGS